uniref:Rho-GAP domain-containing protein n=1 Tax=Esox lucius TaxID=8010 RepID=A0A6Q2Y244_ESOLU
MSAVLVVNDADCCSLFCSYLQHSKAAVQIREDMKRMVQLPTLRGIPGGARGARAEGGGVFGVPLLELREQGLVKDGVPLVVRSMVRFLRDHALHQEGLFRVNGNVRAVEVLKQRLESGEDVNFMDEADVCTVASLLKQYVRDLPEGLVDSTVQNALIQQHQRNEDGFCSDLKDILRRLPDQHYSLLRYLCVFLAQVDQRHQENRMTALNLATVFGPNPVSLPLRPVSLPLRPVSLPLRPVSLPLRPVSLPLRPVSLPLRPVSLPLRPVSLPLSPVSLPLRPSGLSSSLSSLSSSPSGLSSSPSGLSSSPSGLSSSPSGLSSSPSGLSSSPSGLSSSPSGLSSSPSGLSSSPSGLSLTFCLSVRSVLEKTIRSAVEQHLFDVRMCENSEGLTGDSESIRCRSSPPVNTTARQRRRYQREQEEAQRQLDRSGCGHKTNTSKGYWSLFIDIGSACTLCPSYKPQETVYDDHSSSQPNLCGIWCSTEPVPAYSSWQRESMDSDEACISPQVGGRLIRQLIEEDSDPMLSPRFHAYGHCQQYLDDTEVPPSPPNSHSFSSRRRSSSLGSCGDDDREELTSAQLSKKIHSLKRKIRKYEEKFEEERKYRPSHSDKADNPEVLKWMNELEKLKKDLKEHKLHKSEEDLPTMTRQRSNTLPKSFGSQLEKKPQQEKVPKPPVESTLEVVQIKLQEKRKEVGRPEDIKDMTREQISAEKVALQKALLYYEGIHGRPVTKMERQIMKPLYDRYRLVKQILCRASTIPVIGSPSSKRRGPLLQPIIEGEPALFFDDIKEEEDGSEDDSESTNKPQSPVMVRSDFGMIGFLDQLEEETDGFISPVDDLSPSKNNSDMRLSNLHSATMPELVEQLQEAREEKKRIRKNLREFEEQFMRQNGRNVQKEDRSPLAVEYNEYKHIKAKLRLLEVLISKRDVSKFI